MKKLLLSLSGIILLIFVSVNVHASLVYHTYVQPSSSSEYGWVSSTQFKPTSSLYGAWVADDFTLNPINSDGTPVPAGTQVDITNIAWSGFNNWGTSGNIFQFTLFADGSGSPGSTLQVTSGSSEGSGSGVLVYSFGTSFTAYTGTKYWLSIYNTTPSSGWGWVEAENIGNGAIQNAFYIDGGAFYQTLYPPDLAFQLTYAVTPVPIPSAAWLLASGLIGLVVIRRRLRK